MFRIYSLIIAAALIDCMVCSRFEPLPPFSNHPRIEFLRDKMLENYLKINNLISYNEIPKRIIGGVAAAKDEAPFLTQLYRKFVFSYQFLCGGSLITPRTVLSAAHCVSRISNYRIRYGTNSRVWSPYEDAEVEEVKPHPDFDLSTIQNDIALFILKNPIPPSANVKAIELETKQVKPNSSAVLFGFGLTDSSTKTPAIKLQKITQFLVDDDECEEFVSKLNVKKTPGMFCTTSPGSSACNGDSGGPLVNGKNGKQIGIVSFGTRRCPPSSINVYTNVSHYIDWINENKVD